MGLLSFLKKWWPRPVLSDVKVEFVFFGLGNPGGKYVCTRHNIGFRVIDDFIATLTDHRSIHFPEAEVVLGKVCGGVTVAAVKPQTFMNRSGFAVKAVLEHFKVGFEQSLVVVDDFNLPLGTVRLRRNGSDGGHNGLKSIIGQIGTGFPRLRVGIGPLPQNTDIIEFVLGEFNESEEKSLGGVQKKATNVLTNFTAEAIDAVMNKYN